MKWIRVASLIAKDAKVRQLARIAGCDPYKAVGHLVTLWGMMTIEAKDGNLTPYSDEDIEAWADWDGKRGKFAAGVREKLCDEQGVIAAWEKYQGAAIREAEADRVRKSGKKPPGASGGKPPEQPPRGPRNSGAYENENENERRSNVDDAREHESPDVNGGRSHDLNLASLDRWAGFVAQPPALGGRPTGELAAAFFRTLPSERERFAYAALANKSLQEGLTFGSLADALEDWLTNKPQPALGRWRLYLAKALRMQTSGTNARASPNGGRDRMREIAEGALEREREEREGVVG